MENNCLNVSAILLLFSLMLSSSIFVHAGNLYDDLYRTWGENRCKILDNGQLLTVTLDEISGLGSQWKGKYLYSKIEMQIKLVLRNSAGPGTAQFLSSKGDYHDEIDFEFLGNKTGQPYSLHTNVFCQGKGNREIQFRLWFDHTVDFHTYSILWTPKHIVFLVDGIPIREFKNLERCGIPLPKNQPIKLYASLWNADDCATRGGLVKTDWSEAPPFNAYFKNFNTENACVWSRGASSCRSNSIFSPFSNNPWLWDKPYYEAEGNMKWVQKKYMVYNYCIDTDRFPEGLPKECYLKNPNYQKEEYNALFYLIPIFFFFKVCY